VTKWIRVFIKKLKPLIPFLPILAVLEMLFPVTAIFWNDMTIFLTSCGYYGHYFFTHWQLPETLNTITTVLIPAPVFYTYLIQPFQGILSGLVGVNVAFRILVISVLILQIYLIRKLFLKLTRSAAFAGAVAVGSALTIYPFTNLFNRGAVNEFLACGFLRASICCVFLVFIESKRKNLLSLCLQLTICLSLAFGIHPITTLFGGVFITIIAATGWFLLKLDKLKKEKLAALFAAAACVTLILSPWLFATITSLNDIQISAGVPALPAIYPKDLDAFATRFNPFPFDKRALVQGISADGPYIDLQINMPLLLLFVGFIWAIWNTRSANSPFQKYGKALSILSIALFFLTSWMSLSTTPYKLLPSAFALIQFAYRMITYQNLSLFVAVVGLGIWKGSIIQATDKTPRNVALVSICSTLVIVNLLIQGGHAKVVRNSDMQPGYGFQDPDSDELLKMQYAHVGAYLSRSIPRVSLPTDAQVANFIPGQGADFGLLPAQTISTTFDQWIVTNIAAFRWNTVRVDGKPLPVESLRSMVNPSHKDAIFVANEPYFIAFQLKPGLHRVEPYFNPPTIWKMLNRLSLTAFAILVSLLVATRRRLGGSI
jgi:hypothetical protein